MVPFTRLLTQPMTIVKRTPQPAGGYGEDVFVEVGRKETVGQSEPLTGAEQLATQTTATERRRLLLDASDTLTQDDQIVIDGTTWEVTSAGRVRNPRTGRDHHIEALLEASHG